MPQEQLDAAQIHAGFEQMSGECVPQEMGINRLFEVRGFPRLATNPLHATGGDGLVDSGSWKEPGFQASGSVRGAVPEGPFPHTARCHRT